jgi:nucleoside-diphosphate-sugar epimerase
MQNSHRNVLVTGGGGFLGGAIVKKLIERKDQVFSFSRQSHPELSEQGAIHIKGDISNRIAVEKAVKGMDLVFHVAGKAGVWGPYAEFYQTNVVGTENVIVACKKHRVNHLIYTSSPSVVFNGQDMEGVDESIPYPATFHCAYQKTKALAEQKVIKASGNSLKTIILRPHLIWGPGDNHLVPRIIKKARQLKRVGKGKNLVDTVYIDNAAQAHILAADSLKSNPKLSGNIYFISQGEPVLLWEMIDAILNAAGLPPVKNSLSHAGARAAGAVFELIYGLLRISKEPRMTRFIADELAVHHWFDISAAKRDLNYQPKISITEGLEKLAKWLEDTQ